MSKTRQSNITDEQCRKIARTIEGGGLNRGKIARYWADRFGVSIQTVYRLACRGGWQSGRKRRSDAGSKRPRIRLMLPIIEPRHGLPYGLN